jgi:hypothetical protein
MLINHPETTLRGRREQSGEHRHGPCDGGNGKSVTSQNVTIEPDFDLQ